MANVKQTDILTGSIPRQLLAFFLPIWFGTLFQQLYNTADTLIVGNFVGTRALAAVGATGAFVNLLVGLFVGLCSGVGVVVSQSFGARDYDGVDRQVHTALVFSVVIGAVLTLAGLVTAQPMMRLMGTPDEILDASTLYLRIYFLGMIPQILYNTGTYILRAIGDSKRPLYFLIAASLVNIVLDVVFIAVGRGRCGHRHGGQPGGQRPAHPALHHRLRGHALACLAGQNADRAGHPGGHLHHRHPGGGPKRHVQPQQHGHPKLHEQLRHRHHRRLGRLRQN